MMKVDPLVNFLEDLGYEVYPPDKDFDFYAVDFLGTQYFDLKGDTTVVALIKDLENESSECLLDYNIEIGLKHIKKRLDERRKRHRRREAV